MKSNIVVIYLLLSGCIAAFGQTDALYSKDCIRLTQKIGDTVRVSPSLLSKTGSQLYFITLKVQDSVIAGFTILSDGDSISLAIKNEVNAGIKKVAAAFKFAGCKNKQLIIPLLIVKVSLPPDPDAFKNHYLAEDKYLLQSCNKPGSAFTCPVMILQGVDEKRKNRRN